jgi:hypothetical protein
MIEHRVVFAACHKREPSHIGERSPGPILAVEPEQSAFPGKLVCSQIPTDAGEPLTYFLPVMPVPAVAKTAEPLIAMGLTDNSPCPHDLPTLAPSVARSAHVI